MLYLMFVYKVVMLFIEFKIQISFFFSKMNVKYEQQQHSIAFIAIIYKKKLFIFIIMNNKSVKEYDWKLMIKL